LRLNRAVWLGTVETLYESAAMDKPAAEFKGRQAVDCDTEMT
jgi:hypothetical protein